jgi:hypothetical protein
MRGKPLSMARDDDCLSLLLSFSLSLFLISSVP